MTSDTPRHPRRRLPDNLLGLHLEWLADGPPPALAVSLHALGTHTPDAIRAVVQHADTLAALVADHGPRGAARLYLDVELRLRRDRIAAAVAAAVVAQVTVADRDAWHPPGGTLRVLSPVELGTVRLAARLWPVRAATVALSEQGAAPAQLVDIDPSDDVREVDGQLQVDLPAARGVRARTITLDSWSISAVKQAVAQAAAADHSLCVTTDTAGRARRHKTVTATLDRALAVAGVDATATSIRLTRARQILDTQGPPAAAAALGATSVSRSRRLLADLQ